MEITTHIITLLKNPKILCHYNHIFLLSHMRANTSLFGHIMGGNPQIEGYYEMHIGYHSWRSLMREKLMYFHEHQQKPHANYVFDKILHNDHDLSSEVINRTDTMLIFCLRKPTQTIPSILKLYSAIDSSHELCSPEAATEYYCQRLLELERLATGIETGFFYFDAECLREKSDQTLGEISSWLKLDTPLSGSYTLLPKTGRKKAGDTSANISRGTILEGNSDYSTTGIPKRALTAAELTYQKVRKRLSELSTASVLSN